MIEEWIIAKVFVATFGTFPNKQFAALHSLLQFGVQCHINSGVDDKITLCPTQLGQVTFFITGQVMLILIFNVIYSFAPLIIRPCLSVLPAHVFSKLAETGILQKQEAQYVR